MENCVNIFWMRRDLRLDDNHGLFMALSAGLPVRIIFIYDTQILSKIDAEKDRRVTFIINRIKHLNQLLAKYNSIIEQYYGKPQEVINSIISAGNIKRLFYNEDYEPATMKRDREVEILCREKGVEVKSLKDHVIFSGNEILKNDGKPYTVYSPYAKRWRSKLMDTRLTTYPSESLLQNLFSSQDTEKEDIHRLTGFSPLADLDVIPVLPDQEKSRAYANTRDFPEHDGTTRLGHHLRFGTVSIRQVVDHIRENSDTLLGEIIWREFFSQILYHFPHVERQAFKPAYDFLPWENHQQDIERWQEGKTGFPLVDAGMRELKTTGWMHNRVRMVTAGFLIKDLLVDWRIGESWFARHLIDYELASNNGNWQWAAGTGCDAAPYFRVFNPTTQQQRFDPLFVYIKKWVPEYGTSAYPQEMTNHKEARIRAIAHYKKYRIME